MAISAALLIGTGFPPLYAAGLALIANTAPVAFGALGTPIITLAKVTGLPEMQLSAMAGRQLPLFSLIIPAWMVCAMSGWRGLRGVWPAVLVCGGTFAVVQFVISNFVGPSLTDVAGGVASMVGARGAVASSGGRARRGSLRRTRTSTATEQSSGQTSTAYSRREIVSGVDAVGDSFGVRVFVGTAAVSDAARWRQAAGGRDCRGINASAQRRSLVGAAQRARRRQRAAWPVPYLHEQVQPDAKVVGGEASPSRPSFASTG